jgi:energy-coupling factor transporter transmembrane protein EcfT
VINTLAQIDYVASSGTTPWHQASALSKLLFASGVVLLAIFSPSLWLLVVLYAVAWVLALTARLPWRLTLAASGYPVAFTLLFLLARWDGTAGTPLRLLLRPLTASLAAVWLVGTTPYPDLFAPLSRALPRSVGDGLFLTYRALFDLMGRTSGLWRALRLRGGASGPARRRLTLAGEGFATMVLYGFERSQGVYATMLLRGHSGRICGCHHWAEWSRADLLVAAAGLAVTAGAVLLWRMP